MNIIAIILSIIGFLSSIIALLITVQATRLRKKAETDLYNLMRDNSVDIKEKVTKIEEFQKLHKLSKEKILTYEEFGKLNDLIAELAKKLDDKERDQIFEGLNQKSFNSKLDYMDKLLIQSGSTQTQIFKDFEL